MKKLMTILSPATLKATLVDKLRAMLAATLAVTALTATSLLATSCSPYDEGYGDGRYDGLQTITIPITVLADDWTWNPVSGSWTYLFEDIAELTPDVIEHGLYHMYLEVRDGGTIIREALPYTEYREEAGGYLWERTLACDYSAYSIGFYLRSSNFEVGPSETFDFRLVIVY